VPQRVPHPLGESPPEKGEEQACLVRKDKAGETRPTQAPFGRISLSLKEPQTWAETRPLQG